MTGRDRDAEAVRRGSRTSNDLRTIRRVFREVHGWRRWIVIDLLLELLSTPLSLLAPLSLAIVVDSAIGSRRLPSLFGMLLTDSEMNSSDTALVVACVLGVVVVALSQIRSLAATLLENRVGESLTLTMRARMLTHAQRLSFRFHDTRGTADTIYRIQSDAPSIQFIALLGLIPFVTAIVTLVAMIVVVASLDLQLALVALAISPILVLLSRSYRNRMKKRYRTVKKLESQALRIVHEVFAAFRVIKAFGRERDEERRFTEESSISAAERIRVSVADGVFALIINTVTAMGTGLVLFIGVGRVRSGDLTTGSLLLVVSYLGALYGPLQTISRQIGRLQGYLTSAERVFELLDEEPEVLDDPNALQLDRCLGDFELRSMSFAYEPGHDVLSNVDLRIPGGSRIGIVGRTGAGKSTLVSLLIRFYDVTGGEILLDGIDIRRYRLDDLRNQFSVVLQDPFLFSTSVGENIAYAKPTASMEEITRAAAAAGIHEFIESLPEGYRTVVGERGMRLSGGERQRISIARAFLKDAPVLLLDEPTSSVDVETEAGIMEAMARLMEGRTTFMIAHRLSTLDSCELVAQVSDGRVEIIRRGCVSPAPTWAPPAGQSLEDDPLAEALSIWSELSGEPAGVRQGDPLFSAKKQPKRLVYRLASADPATPPVIAKVARHDMAELERTIGGLVEAPGLPMLEIMGMGKGATGSRYWMFQEDAGEQPVDEADPEQRAVVAAWLGTLHGATVGLAVPSLPVRGCGHYREHLDRASVVIASALDDEPSTEMADVLTRSVDVLNSAAAVWPEIERLAVGRPDVLVHGDLVSKNLRIRGQGRAASLLVFDWDTAGMGPPFADLWWLWRWHDAATLEAYVAPVGDRLGSLDEAEVLRWAASGEVFRQVAALDWDSRSLEYQSEDRYRSFVEKKVRNIALYSERLASAIQGMGPVARR